MIEEKGKRTEEEKRSEMNWSEEKWEEEKDAETDLVNKGKWNLS